MNLRDSGRRVLIRAREDYWGVLVLAAWGAAVLGLGLVRFDAFGIDEAGAHALLLVWSVGERIISTVVLLGLPDLRAVLLAPLGAYWPGSMIAAKVHALLITAAAVTMLYRWARRTIDAESALIASGLLLIAPATLFEIDALGAGPYLLLAFGVGLWIDRKYRLVQRPLGGWFFAQLLWIMIAVSIHPAALAYPAALLWEWRTRPLDARQQRHVYIGVTVAIALILILRLGWPTLDWLDQPFVSLYQAVLGRDAPGTALAWLLSILLAMGAIGAGIASRRLAAEDMMTRMLLLAVLFGLPAADGAWAMLVMAMLLYLGMPRLIAFNRGMGLGGFVGQRGLVLGLVFIASIVFMQVGKAHRYAISQNHLPPVDQLLLAFSAEVEDTGGEEATMTMSQWPGKTMLATRRHALPLPPPFADHEALLKNVANVDFLLFDPKDERNETLAAQLAELTGVTETILLEEAGVAVRFRGAP
ncbi:MAG: hypothetical protein RBT81_01040 [Gammaproteobacteria bacterium]|jgi:hypothetical protein|nr:hypothetical protein [Gammaproteobacteria bacterium]